MIQTILWGILILSSQYSSVPCHKAGKGEGCEIETAVVFGAGPAGSAAALALAEKGVKNVFVFERRCSEYTRPIHFNVRASFRQTMKMFGVEKPFLKICGVITDSKNNDQILNIDKSGPPPEYREREDIEDYVLNHFDQILKEPSLYQCKSSELETMLHQNAVKKGVKYSFQIQLNVIAPHKGKYYSINAENPLGDQIRNPDLIVVADGKGCSTAKALGVVSESRSRITYHIAGLYNKGIGGKSIRKTYLHDGKVTRAIILGHSKLDETWIVIQVPEALVEEARSWSKEKIMQFYTSTVNSVASDVLSSEAQVVWGANAVFEVQSSEINKNVLGNNVVIIGDATRAANFQTGGGAMTAVVADTLILKKYIDEVKISGPKTALATLSDRIRKSSAAWISASLAPFDMYEPDPNEYFRKYSQSH